MTKKCKICKMAEGFHGVWDGERFIEDMHFLLGQGNINSEPISITLNKHRVCNICLLKFKPKEKA